MPWHVGMYAALFVVVLESAYGGRRPAMNFCFLGAGVKERLNKLIEPSREELRKREPFVIEESITIGRLMSVHNFRLYGLHSAYVKEATLSCNDSFLESTVDVQLRDIEVISDWTAASWVMLAGSAHLVADALELECSILMPAEEGSRVVVSSMRLVELRISSVNVTGPFSTIWLEVGGGGTSSGLYTLGPEHRRVARVLEQILVRIAQRRLDRVEWAI